MFADPRSRTGSAKYKVILFTLGQANILRQDGNTVSVAAYSGPYYISHCGHERDNTNPLVHQTLGLAIYTPKSGFGGPGHYCVRFAYGYCHKQDVISVVYSVDFLERSSSICRLMCFLASYSPADAGELPLYLTSNAFRVERPSAT